MSGDRLLSPVTPAIPQARKYGREEREVRGGGATSQNGPTAARHQHVGSHSRRDRPAEREKVGGKTKRGKSRRGMHWPARFGRQQKGGDEVGTHGSSCTRAATRRVAEERENGCSEHAGCAAKNQPRATAHLLEQLSRCGPYLTCVCVSKCAIEETFSMACRRLAGSSRPPWAGR
eukprot:6173567-Pleurochrysis_carterae.AAC.4